MSTCSTSCVDGGSCTAATGAPGIPALNTCIAGGAIRLDVETLAVCCSYLRSDGASSGGTVGYNGRTQTCAADVPAGEAGATSSGPIRLFNPLGRDTDIPAFIGRGIRGVLGAVSARAADLKPPDRLCPDRRRSGVHLPRPGLGHWTLRCSDHTLVK